MAAGTAIGFVSYAHVDQGWFERFREAVAPLVSQQVLRLWSDHALVPGDVWDPELMRRLDEADLILLLVTPAFLGSKFCFGREMRRGLARHDAGLARVIPVILEPCDWQNTPFARIQGVPRGMIPVSQAADQAAVLQDIAREIRAAALRAKPLAASDISQRPESLFTEAQLMSMIDRVKRSISLIQNAIAHLPPGQQPIDKLIELAELQTRLQTYEAEFSRRIET
jgi:hypothetical protein